MTQVLQECLEQEVTTGLGRAKRSPRRISSQARSIDWQCGFCGSSDANQFIRDGHYRRSLETGWRHLDVVRVPMVEYQRCEHDVVAQFAILEKYQRYWLDAPQRAIIGLGLSQSLRQLSQEWAASLEAIVGLRTIVSPHQSVGSQAGSSASPPDQRGPSSRPVRWHLAEHADPARGYPRG